MAELFLGTIDYGPVYRALNVKSQVRRAGLGLTQAALGLGSDVAEAGIKVYELFEDTRFAEFQGKAAEEYRDFESKIIAGVKNRWIRPNEQGQIVYDEITAAGEGLESSAKSLAETYQYKLEELAKGYKGNRKVQKYLQTTAKDMAAALLVKAQEAVLEQTIQERETTFAKQNYPEAIKQSIEQETTKPLRDLILASPWLGPERQNDLLRVGEKQVWFGINRLAVKRMAQEQGPEAALAYVDEQEKTGKFTAEEADDLRKGATDTGRTTLSADAKAATDAFDRDVARLGPEGAYQATIAGLRPSTRAEVTRVLEAHKAAWVKRRSDTATEALQGYFAQHANDPADVLAHFLDNTNGYSESMDEMSWRIWYNFLQSEADAKASGGTKGLSPAQIEFALKYFSHPTLTNGNVSTILNDWVRTGRMSFADAGYFYNQMPDRQYIMAPEVIESRERLNAYYERKLKKAGSDKDFAKYNKERGEALRAFDDFAVSGKAARKPGDFVNWVNTRIAGERAYTLFEDERPIGTKNQRQRARGRILAKDQTEFIDTPDERAAWEETDLRAFIEDFRIPQENITPVPFYDVRGLTVFAIKGLDPKSPDKTYLAYMGIDEKTGLEHPWIVVESPDGRFIGYRRADFLESPPKREERERREAARASYEAALAAEKAREPIAPEAYYSVDDYLSQFPPFSNVSQTALRAAADKLGVSYMQLLEMARGRGLQITQEAPKTYHSIDEYLSQFEPSTEVAEAELRTAAGRLGVPYERLLEAARGRGLRITRGVPRR